ncbi:RNA-binding domain-containing protein [Ceraceosorus guamensis]|uniref:RNA-binding domain-containing protein n=1 Tax=Ceraceosorus guamensis TaxID=1522189 RepID=A0A316W4P4_9BASI|nr:RNA-binding domain-containing protein [Ceraceosorus guamensis]PWN44534.1 RNA-binding domain-containing protein [Ceraceosorus guamensis]
MQWHQSHHVGSSQPGSARQSEAQRGTADLPSGLPMTSSSSHPYSPQLGSFTLPPDQYYDSPARARAASNAPLKRGDAGLTVASSSSQALTASPGSGPTTQQAEPAGAYEIFVGDLSKNINDSALRSAFASFPTLIDARVMWDTSSGKSRGYGFVTFHSRAEAEQAIAVMNGEVLGARPVRVNWATVKKPASESAAKPQVPAPRPSHAIGLGMPPTAGAASGTPLSYQTVYNSAPLDNTTIYVGNLPPMTSAGDLVMIFSQFSTIQVQDVRMQPDKGFAFVRLDTHENATRAIVLAAGHVLHNQRIKTGWGKDRLETNMRRAAIAARAAAASGMVQGTDAYGMPMLAGFPAQAGQGQSPMYNMSLMMQTPNPAYPVYPGAPTNQPGSANLPSVSRNFLSTEQPAQLSLVAPPYASASGPPQVAVVGYGDLPQQQVDLRPSQGWPTQGPPQPPGTLYAQSYPTQSSESALQQEVPHLQRQYGPDPTRPDPSRRGT